VANQMQLVKQAHEAMNKSQAQAEQQRAIATQAEADMRAAQAKAADATEILRLEKETEECYTEETKRVVSETKVLLQQAEVCIPYPLV
jgi:hypothetical protein